MGATFVTAISEAMDDLATDIAALGIAVIGVTVAYVAIRWAVRLFKGA